MAALRTTRSSYYTTRQCASKRHLAARRWLLRHLGIRAGSSPRLAPGAESCGAIQDANLRVEAGCCTVTELDFPAVPLSRGTGPTALLVSRTSQVAYMLAIRTLNHRTRSRAGREPRALARAEPRRSAKSGSCDARRLLAHGRLDMARVRRVVPKVLLNAAPRATGLTCGLLISCGEYYVNACCASRGYRHR